MMELRRIGGVLWTLTPAPSVEDGQGMGYKRGRGDALDPC